MIDGALLSEEMNDFNGIATLPEKVAEIVVGANFFADSFAQFDERARIIDDKVGVHLESERLDAVLARGSLSRCIPTLSRASRSRARRQAARSRDASQLCRL